MRERHHAIPSQDEPQPPLAIPSAPSLTSGDKPPADFWRWVKIFLEIGALITAVSLACLTNQTLREVKKQADAAQSALSANIDFFHTDERAWVEIESITKTEWKLPLEILRKGFSRAFIYHVYPRNFGKTVARNVKVRATVGTSAPYEQSSSAFFMDEMQNKFLFGMLEKGKANFNPPLDYIPKTLAPGTPSSAPYDIVGSAPKDVLIVAPQRGLVRYYSFLIGRIDYSDVFGVGHWKKFCLLVSNDAGDLKNCQEGNDEDTNTEKTKQEPSPSPPFH